MSFIVVLVPIISILSAGAIEVTVKGVITLSLSLLALALVSRQKGPRHFNDSVLVHQSESHIEDYLGHQRKRDRVGRLVIGSVLAGCIVAVIVAVLISTLATQLLNRLG
jgi:hypothetical protein